MPLLAKSPDHCSFVLAAELLIVPTVTLVQSLLPFGEGGAAPFDGKGSESLLDGWFERLITVSSARCSVDGAKLYCSDMVAIYVRAKPLGFHVRRIEYCLPRNVPRVWMAAPAAAYALANLSY